MELPAHYAVPKAEGDGAVQAWIDLLPDWQTAHARTDTDRKADFGGPVAVCRASAPEAGERASGGSRRGLGAILEGDLPQEHGSAGASGSGGRMWLL